jgi:putative CocE/NonD family hydrolase
MPSMAGRLVVALAAPLALSCVLFPVSAFATSVLVPQFLYHEETFHVKMRDGVLLRSAAFIPGLFGSKTPRATVLIRTPYGAESLFSQCKQWAESHELNCVAQDVRGRHESGGSYDFWRTSANDTADTRAWLLAQPWSNGVVFNTGTSANGIAGYLSPQEKPSEFYRAQMVVVATAQVCFSVCVTLALPFTSDFPPEKVHAMCYQQGTYRTSLIDGWLTAIKEPPYMAKLRDHEAFSESYWGTDTLAPDKWGVVTYPTVNVAGWYDIFSQWQIDAYGHYVKSSANTAFLVMLPTGHCRGGAIDWPNVDEGSKVALGLTAELFKIAKDSKVPCYRDSHSVDPLASFPSLLMADRLFRFVRRVR